MRVTIRQLREVVGRLLWCIKSPSGLENAATRLVIERQIRSGDGLALLWDEVVQGRNINPAAVSVVSSTHLVTILEGGDQPALYVAPLAMDLALAGTARRGLSLILVRNIHHPSLAGGLAAMLVERTGGVATVGLGDEHTGFFQLWHSGRATGPEKSPDFAGQPPTRSALSFFAARASVGASPAAETRWETLLRDGIDVDEELWDAAYAKSLDVLLRRARRQFTSTGSIAF